MYWDIAAFQRFPPLATRFRGSRDRKVKKNYYIASFSFAYSKRRTTLGGRGFSCAVSDVGYVSIVTRAKTL